MDEKEAISRLKRRDIGGLEFLVQSYQAQAVQATYLITHNRFQAEDIVQDSFLRVYECIRQFDTTIYKGVINPVESYAGKHGQMMIFSK